jgi:hypothetical protein
MSLQTNGICEAFHEVVRNEFCRAGFRKKLYPVLKGLQKGLDRRSEE